MCLSWSEVVFLKYTVSTVHEVNDIRFCVDSKRLNDTAEDMYVYILMWLPIGGVYLMHSKRCGIVYNKTPLKKGRWLYKNEIITEKSQIKRYATTEYYCSASVYICKIKWKKLLEKKTPVICYTDIWVYCIASISTNAYLLITSLFY